MSPLNVVNHSSHQEATIHRSLNHTWSSREPKPPPGYVVSFICLHERGFNAPTSRFMQGLCHHYEVELHNFAPNAISQAASFIDVCEGFFWGLGELGPVGPSLPR
jgi:hypothetical protein